MVRVINNRNRLYNWARKWQILDIDNSKVDDYIRAWFSVVKEKIEKKNIVIPNQNLKTVKECKDILDHAGVEYDKKLKVSELNKLVLKLESEKTNEDETKDDVNYWELLVDEWILDESELEWKSEKELKQLASDNWLI
jgi:hypothetical protein